MVKDGNDLLETLLSVNGNEETRARRGKEEQERSTFMLNTLREAANTLLDKREIDHDASPSLSKRPRVWPEEPSIAQPFMQPNRHDASSPSFSKRPRVVSEEPSIAQPFINMQPNRHDASSPSLSKRRPVVSEEPSRAQPKRKTKPVRRKPVKREPVRREQVVTPGWVDELMRKNNGADVKLVIEKKIKASDLNKNQGRLNMPFNQIADMDFLTKAEANFLEIDRRKAHKEGIDVILVDADGKEWKPNLRIWDMNTTSNYVLCSKWKKVVEHHDPEVDLNIRLWSFHSQDGTLYFAINLKLPPGNTDQPLAQDSSQAVAQSLAPAIATASTSSSSIATASASSSSSSMALVVTRDSGEAFLCEETNRRLINFPKRRMTTRARVPAPSRDSGNLGASTVEDLDLNRHCLKCAQRWLLSRLYKRQIQGLQGSLTQV